MVELASRGAGVLHPRSVELANQHAVRLLVRNSLNEKEGTEIMTTKETHSRGMEEFEILGVTGDASRALVTVELQRSTVLGAIWETAARAHLTILTPTFSGTTVQFFAERDSEDEWKKLLQSLGADGFVRSYTFDSALAPLSVVGNRFAQDGAGFYEVIETLAKAHVNSLSASASALGVTLAVPLTHLDDGVRALHSKYFPEGNS
jgi:aspartate kinase